MTDLLDLQIVHESTNEQSQPSTSGPESLAEERNKLTPGKGYFNVDPCYLVINGLSRRHCFLPRAVTLTEIELLARTFTCN